MDKNLSRSKKVGVALTCSLIFSLVATPTVFAGDNSGESGVAPMAVREAQAEIMLSEGEYSPQRIIVMYDAATTAEQKQRVRDSVTAASHEELMDDVELLMVPHNDLVEPLATLLGDPAVASAEPDNLLRPAFVGEPEIVDAPSAADVAPTSRVEPFDLGVATDLGAEVPEGWAVQGPSPVGDVPASLYGSNASGAWLHGYKGSNEVVIAVIDSGVDVNHPDVVSNIWRNPAEVLDGKDNDGNGLVDDLNGWNFHDNNNQLYSNADNDFHGTHIAGTIAAAENGFGVVGVAPKTKILPVKFISGEFGTDANAVKAINYVVTMKNQGAPVTAINASWGGRGYSSAIAAAIQNAGNNGILFVAAAGNDSLYGASFPANFSCSTTGGTDCVISVGSHDANGQPSIFTNYHPSNVDLSAPGGDILSIYPDDRYALLSGTSMAAPHVAAFVATCRGITSNFGLSVKRPTVLEATRPYAQFNTLNAEKGILDIGLGASNCGEARVPPYLGDKKITTMEGVAQTVRITPHGRTKTGTWSFATPVAGASISQNGTITYNPTKYGTPTLQVRFKSSNNVTTTSPLPLEARVFMDIEPGAYYEQAAHWLKREEITSGTSPTTYSPGRGVTRAEMSAFLWRAAGEPSASNHVFRDEGSIPSYARTATDWLYRQRITTNDPYRPGGPVTRAEMSAFLWRAAGEPSASNHVFRDEGSIPGYARTATDWLYRQRITDNDPYRPDTLVTRGQMAAFLWRAAGEPS